MSALAIAFKKQGWQVTGSDVGFYPPVSTHLKEAGINFYPGWHPEKMGVPDLVVVGNVASSSNPEWLTVKEKNITYQSYPEVIKEFFVKKNSIVVAGTYGKSTSSCLLSWILQETGLNPTYMFGGIALNNLPPAEMSAGEWSVLEGDEYKASRWDTGAKFFYYSPTHLLLTSVVWDHADVYPTEAEYIGAFQELVESVPLQGLCVLSEKAIPVLKTTRNYISYGKTAGNDYFYTDVKENASGLNFLIKYKDQTFSIESKCLGDYMADNITGCFALCHKIGLPPEKIITAIQNFRGMKRRLEKRYEGEITVFDDIAHSPTKAEAVLRSLRHIYAGKIYAVFEPNTGHRQREARAGYAHAFSAADEVYIPRLTKIKINSEDSARPMEGDELAKIIGETNPHVSYEPDDDHLVQKLLEKTSPGDVIVFLGSHSFRGMIESLISKLSL